jgi:hypothetical protein
MAVREGVYDVLKTAFADAGVDYGSCEAVDRDDGALIWIPADISKACLSIDSFLPMERRKPARRHSARIG